MRKAILASLASVISILTLFGTPSVLAQDAASQCSDFQVYWEALVATVPNDPEGQEALLDVFDAGGLTVITPEVQTLAFSYLNQWATNMSSIDPALIPPSAQLFHEDLVEQTGFDSGLIEYSEAADLENISLITSVGTYFLLISEVPTPSVCT